MINIFSFGISSDNIGTKWINDINYPFLRLLSLQNNGYDIRIKDSNNMYQTLYQNYRLLETPILRNVSINYSIIGSDWKIEPKSLTTTNFSTVYSSNDITICGKAYYSDRYKINKTDSSMGSGIIINDVFNMTMTANSNHKDEVDVHVDFIKPISVTQTVKLDTDNVYNKNSYNYNHTKYNNTIERLWAYLRLQEFDKQETVSQKSIETPQSDGIENDLNFNLYDLSPTDLALKFEFVTPWTSMIVVKYDNDTDADKSDDALGVKHGDTHGNNHDQDMYQLPNGNDNDDYEYDDFVVLDLHAKVIPDNINNNNNIYGNNLDKNNYKNKKKITLNDLQFESFAFTNSISDTTAKQLTSSKSEARFIPSAKPTSAPTGSPSMPPTSYPSCSPSIQMTKDASSDVRISSGKNIKVEKRRFYQTYNEEDMDSSIRTGYSLLLMHVWSIWVIIAVYLAC